MPLLMRVISGLSLLAIAAFCVFGLLATGEIPDRPTAQLGLRVAYSAVGLCCLAGIVWLVRQPRSGSSA